MRIEYIKVAQNGFVLEDSCGYIHVARTLLEIAEIAGEVVPQSGSTVYDANYSALHLADVRTAALQGRKIDAIKILRNCFVPRLGLREAKDLVEQLCPFS
jgi:ribosomal protein L7/L12